jgi:hypothetical protein
VGLAPFRTKHDPRRWPPILQLTCEKTASADPLSATCAFKSCWLMTRVVGAAPNLHEIARLLAAVGQNRDDAVGALR